MTLCPVSFIVVLGLVPPKCIHSFISVSLLLADVRNGGPNGVQVCLNHLYVDRDYGSVVGLANVGVICSQGSRYN